MARPRGTRTTAKNLPKGKVETWVSVKVANLTSRKMPGRPSAKRAPGLIPICRTVTTTRYIPVD